MRRVVNIAILSVIVLSSVMSCKAISEFFDRGEVVAEVGSAKLKKAELELVIPDGISSEDSVRLAKQYINSWALDQIFLNLAEEQLSKTEKDVTKELEAYRTSLLKYRYEQLFVNERLDTSVTDDAVQEYYDAHHDKFVLARPLVKARFMSIPSDSPMLKIIRKKMSSDEAEDIMEADSMAFSAAYKFYTWNNEWIDAVTLAAEYGSGEFTSVMSSMAKGWIERTDTSGVTNVAYVSEFMPKGKMAPIEYSTPFIKDMIISARKKQLVSTLEHDLLEDARVNGQFITVE